MISLLLKLKSVMHIISICIALGAICYGWYWHSQFGKSQATNAQLIQQNATLKANHDLLESAVQRWKAAAQEYDTRLKRREALVAKMNAENKKRVNDIQQFQYSPDCNTAIKQGLELVNDPKVGFHWDNNIP